MTDTYTLPDDVAEPVQPERGDELPDPPERDHEQDVADDNLDAWSER